MSFTIRIEPTGHSFTSLPEETLLEAALRSGININYNCSNGSCGDCKAKLLSGDIESIPADYRFSSREKNEGYILLCTSRAASDLVITAQEAHSSKDIPHQRISTKVVKIEERGENIRILHLRTPRTKTLRFLAGQHVALILSDESRIDAPVASCPCNGMQLQFHIHRRAGSSFAQHLFNDMRTGETVELKGPFGDVTLDDDARRPLVMLAVSEGFAAIKSLIEHAINLDLRQPLRLFWLADSSTGHYLQNYCRSWGEVLDDYRFIPLQSSAEEPNDIELSGLVEAIGREVPRLADADIYVAGPLEVQRQLLQLLAKQGADRERVFLPRSRRS